VNSFLFVERKICGFHLYRQTTKLSAPWKAYVTRAIMNKCEKPQIQMTMNISKSVYPLKLISDMITGTHDKDRCIIDPQ
jgi:hypothetical protein